MLADLINGTAADIPAEDIAEVVAMSDDELDALIHTLCTDGAKPGDWDLLYSPLLVARTKSALTRNKKAVGDQGGRRVAPALWDELLKRGREVEVAARVAHEQHQERVKAVERKVISRLAMAIERHRLANGLLKVDAKSHDLALWSLLDELTMPFENGEATLGELVRDVWRERDDTTPDGGTVTKKRTCGTKYQHRSLRDARRHIDVLVRRGASPDPAALNAYTCHWCGFWHVGHLQVKGAA